MILALAILGGITLSWFGLVFIGALLGAGHVHVPVACSPERWSETGRIVTASCACGQTCDIERMHNGAERIVRSWQ